MIHRSRSTYWSCTKLADWIRGTPKNGAKTSKGWREWRKEARGFSPLRYWLAEEALDKIQDFVMFPSDIFYSVKYYINNRWVTKTHCLSAHPRDIKPGEWCDVGNRFLPCLFNELVDFVEIELAWSNVAWDKEARKKYNPPFYAFGFFRWRTWRCPEAGIDNLTWQTSLTNSEYVDETDPSHGEPTIQAKNAKEILELYNWWTKVYPNRPDPYDASGWTEICNKRRNTDIESIFDFEDRSKEEELESRTALDKCNEIEESYEKENEEMLIRLIKVRNSLWT